MKKGLEIHNFLVILYTIVPITIFIGSFGIFIYSITNCTLALSLIELEKSIYRFFPLIVAATLPIVLVKNGDAVAMISSIISYVILTEILNPETLQSAFYNANYSTHISFFYIGNIFFGILCGLLTSYVFKKYQMISLPSWLSFFSGRRSVPIITSLYTIALAFSLYFVWPILFQTFLEITHFLIDRNIYTKSLVAVANQLFSPIFFQENPIQLFDVTNTESRFCYISVISVSAFLLNTCRHYRGKHNYIFSLIIIFCILVRPTHASTIILLFIFSPLLYIIHGLSIGLSIFLFNLTNWQIVIIYILIYLLGAKYVIYKNWSPLYFLREHIVLPSKETLYLAIGAIGDFENIKDIRASDNYLVITVYEMDFVNKKLFKHITGWTISLESEFELYISTDISPYIIMNTLKTIKEEENKLLLI